MLGCHGKCGVQDLPGVGGGKLQILRRSLSPGSAADLDPSDEFTGQCELCPEDETYSRMAVFVAMCEDGKSGSRSVRPARERRASSYGRDD